MNLPFSPVIENVQYHAHYKHEIYIVLMLKTPTDYFFGDFAHCISGINSIMLNKQQKKLKQNPFGVLFIKCSELYKIFLK